MMRPLGSHLDLSSEEGRNSEYYTLIADLLDSDVVCRMKEFTHHGSTSCFQHCLNVSYYNYLLCKLLSLNARAGARAGLLHDLFLYDWHTRVTPKGERNHAFSHASRALTNARQYFYLSDVESDIIEKHMFPVTIRPPKYKETVIIILTDKYCGAAEVLVNLFAKAKGLFTRNRRKTAA